MPPPPEILLNQIQECSGQPPQPFDQEAVCNYLLLKKTIKKQYYNKVHNLHPLPKLTASQEILFLSPTKQNTYILGTITVQLLTPHSYIIDAQGK